MDKQRYEGERRGRKGEGDPQAVLQGLSTPMEGGGQKAEGASPQPSWPPLFTGQTPAAHSAQQGNLWGGQRWDTWLPEWGECCGISPGGHGGDTQVSCGSEERPLGVGGFTGIVLSLPGYIRVSLETCAPFFSFFFFLILPLYCYQPISLHPRAHMPSHITPWTTARQAPLSMDFSRQEYWSGLPFPSPTCVPFNVSLCGVQLVSHFTDGEVNAQRWQDGARPYTLACLTAKPELFCVCVCVRALCHAAFRRSELLMVAFQISDVVTANQRRGSGQMAPNRVPASG